MKLGVSLVVFGGLNLLISLALVLTVLHSHNWDWTDLFWVAVGGLCLLFGILRLQKRRSNAL